MIRTVLAAPILGAVLALAGAAGAQPVSTAYAAAPAGT